MGSLVDKAGKSGGLMTQVVGLEGK